MSWALVTGASSGIGRATAIALSTTYDLILCARDEDKLKETQASCDATNKSILFPFDLGKTKNLTESLSTFLKEHNIEVEAFAHCAGVSRLLPLKTTTLDDFQATLDVNLVAPFLIVKALINRRVNATALRSCVFISSNISNRGSKAFAAYGASKSGIDGLMRCLAIELAPKVRINSVLPGAVKTRMTQDIFANEEVVKKLQSHYPLGLGEPNDIAQAVVFLLSDNARWITGQQFVVDGGATIDVTA